MPDFKNIVVHIVKSLKQKKFVFLSSQELEDEVLRKELGRFDERTSKFSKIGLTVVNYLIGAPPVLKTLESFFLKFGMERKDEAAIDAVCKVMKEQFQLNALKFSQTGTKYLACLDCNQVSHDQLVSKVHYFEEIADSLKIVTGKLRTRILGIPVGKGVEPDVYCSLCLIFTKADHYRNLEPTVNKIKLKGTSLFMNFLSKQKAWVPIWYFSSPPKGAVYLDKIVYTVFNNQIRDSKAFRIAWFYGFSIDDLLWQRKGDVAV